MSGKIGKAPCGHRGEAIVGQFYRCIEGCVDDSVPEPDEFGFDLVEESTREMCPEPSCRSTNIGPYFAPYYAFTTHCNDCGKVW